MALLNIVFVDTKPLLVDKVDPYFHVLRVDGSWEGDVVFSVLSTNQLVEEREANRVG